MCGTNNIQRDSSEDIVEEILEIALTLRRKYNHLNIIVCDLLPHDENWSVNQIYNREINDYLSCKCDLNGVNFINPNDWTLRNSSLKASLYHFDNLHLIKDGNIKLSESIVNVIKPNSKTTESVSILSKLFNHSAYFNFNDKDFPPLPCSTTVYDNLSVPVMFIQVNLFVLVMLIQVNLFVLVMFIQVNLFILLMFILVNLFMQVMFVQVNLFVLVMFIQVNLFGLVMFVQVNLFVIVMSVHVNLFLPEIFVQVKLFLLVMFVQENLFVLIVFVQINLLVPVMFV